MTVSFLRLALGLAAAAAACGAEEPTPAPGALQLAPVFADHAVLQREKPVPVFGRAKPGEKVTVTFRTQTSYATADAQGHFEAWLKPMPANAHPADLAVSSGGETAVIHDVLVGEVWLCSGQSNMEFTVDDGGNTYRVVNAQAELAAANDPFIRQFKVERTVATAPTEAAKNTGWVLASPQTVGHFTAVGYFFARELRRSLNVPVGIILSCWGGTTIEAWLSDEARASTPFAEALAARWGQARADWPADRVARYPAAMEAWQKAQAAAEASHTKNTLPWPQPPATDSSPARPGGLYYGMITPLQPVALRGILWYQGESNVGHAGEYPDLSAALVRTWRAAWHQEQLSFYFVQLPNWADGGKPEGRSWAWFREDQARLLAVRGTGMAVTIDVGDPQNLHPRNKQEVGRRLALIAEAREYGQPVESSGPVYEGFVREGASLRIHFLHTGTHLTVRNGAPGALEICGPDWVFHPAVGKIQERELVVESPEVARPEAVRYAWTNAPAANLYGETGLPVAPFRTDGW